MSTQLNAATRLRAAKLTPSAVLREVFKHSTPETDGPRTSYVLVPQADPRGLAQKLKRDGWLGKPSTQHSSFVMTNLKYAGFQLEVSQADDLEEDEMEELGMSEDDDCALVTCHQL